MAGNEWILDESTGAFPGLNVNARKPGGLHGQPTANFHLGYIESGGSETARLDQIMARALFPDTDTVATSPSARKL